MKRFLAGLAAVGVTAVAGAAFAQTDPRILQERQAARMELEAARQAQMASDREAQAARDRAATAQTLRGLQAQGGAAGQPYRPPPAQVLPERGDPSSAASLGLEQLDRLTDARLARSNEVLRAIRPASER